MTLRYLIQKELLQIRRNSFLPKLIVMFPIMIMCVMPWVMQMEVKNIRVDVVDIDRTTQSQRLVHDIEASNYFIFNGMQPTYQAAMTDVEHGKADIILEIRDGKYLIAANEKAIELYNRRVDLKLESTGISPDIRYSIFNYSMWEYVMIALCVLMTVRLFSCEYSTGAYRTVNTSKKTVQSLFFKKYFAVVSVAVGVLIVQAIFELVMGACVFGLKNLSLPIQQIQMYEYCPYAMSIAQFYLFKFLLKVLAYVTIISLCTFVTALVKRPLISNIILLPISAGGLLANMVLFVKIDNAEKFSLSVLSAYDRLRIILPQSLLNFKEYIKKFDCFSLFGHPVSRLSACVCISLSICALCVIFGYKISGRTRRSV